MLFWFSEVGGPFGSKKKIEGTCKNGNFFL
jgi:hypothetical protein